MMNLKRMRSLSLDKLDETTWPDVFRLGLMASLVLFGLYQAWLQKWIADDGYIYLTYIRNLLEHGQLVFNLGEHVDGSTSFLWPLLISAAHAAASAVHDFTLQQTTILVSLLIYAAFLHQLFQLETRDEKFVLPIATLFACSAYMFHSFATSGLETPLAMLWIALLSRIAFANDPQRVFFGFVIGAAPFVRPELFIFSALLLVRDCWAARSTQRLSILLLSSAGFGLAFAFARYCLFGDVVPNTFYAKTGGESSITWALRYLQDFSNVYRLEYLIVLSVPVVTAFLFDTGLRSPYVMVLVFVSTYLAALFVTGGDFMHGRFMIPVAPPLLLIVSHALNARFKTASVPGLARATAISVTAGMFALLVASYETPQRTFGTGFRGIDDESFGYFSRNANLYRWAKPNLHPWASEGSRLTALSTQLQRPIGAAAGGIGQIGFYRDPQKVFILDRLGLVHPVTSAIDMGGYDRRIGHNRLTPEVLAYYDKRVTFYSTPDSGLNDLLRFTFDGQWFIPIDFSVVPELVGLGLLRADTEDRVHNYIKNYLKRDVVDANFLYFLYLRYEGRSDARQQIEQLFSTVKEQSTWWNWIDAHGALVSTMFNRANQPFGNIPLRLGMRLRHGSSHPIPMLYHSKALTANPGNSCQVSVTPLASAFSKAAEDTNGIEVVVPDDDGKFTVDNQSDRDAFVSATARVAGHSAGNFLRFIPGHTENAPLGYFYVTSFDPKGKELSKNRFNWPESTDVPLSQAGSITVSLKVPAQSSLTVKNLEIRVVRCPR